MNRICFGKICLLFDFSTNYNTLLLKWYLSEGRNTFSASLIIYL